MSCFIIAEAGVNHNGSLDLAHELVDIAARSGADAIKFQTFKADLLAKPGADKAEYQKANTYAEGDQLDMLRKLELSESAHEELYKHCQEEGIEFMSTPFDIGSAKFLVDVGMTHIKIPSGELTNLPFIESLANFKLPMILSTGMGNLEEVGDAVEVIKQTLIKTGCTQPLKSLLKILHCTSNYPTKPEDTNLTAMLSMAKEFGVEVGYSDHTDGIIIPVAAVAMGAKVIEKHFTIDRSLPGPDHKASLEPDELAQMVLDIRTIENSLGDGVKNPRPSELPVRELVRRSVTLVSDKKQGEAITIDDLTLLRPGTGISPKHLSSLVNKELRLDMKAGDTLTWADLVE